MEKVGKEGVITVEEGKGLISLATTKGATFLANPVLHQEVFGPYSLIIIYKL